MLSEETHKAETDMHVFNYLEKCRIQSEHYFNHRDNLNKLIEQRHRFILQYLNNKPASNEEISIIITLLKMTDESITQLLSI